jgi:hypothetical protein
MALTQCRECRREIPADTNACPHCGAQQPAASMATAKTAGFSAPSTFRRPPAPPPHPAGSATKLAAPLRLNTKSEREAVARQRFIWIGSVAAVVLLLLGLARTVSMWMVLAPLGILCLGAMVVGTLRAIQNEGLPSFPKTRRGHSLLVVFAAPLVFLIAFDLAPKTLEEQRHFDDMQRRAEQQRAEKDRRLHAHIACQTYVTERLKAPSSAEFSRSAEIVPRDEGGYLIRGSIEAQNAFGVKLRRNYLCAVDPAGQVVRGTVVE